jgi:glycine/D-amino acid oxidase-like deaminating enzyme
MEHADVSRTDVLVVGAGAAGLRAAIAIQQARGEVVVVGKRARGDAHTVLAAGGINAVLGTRDPEGGLLLERASIPPVPEPFRPLLAETAQVVGAARLLE